MPSSTRTRNHTQEAFSRRWSPRCSNCSTSGPERPSWRSGRAPATTPPLMAEIVGDQRLVVTVDVADDVVAQTRRLLARAGYPGIAVLLRDGVEGSRPMAASLARGLRRRGRPAVLSQLGGPPGLLGAWWGRVERPERLGRGRSGRHPLVEGCRPGGGTRPPALGVARTWPAFGSGPQGRVRPHRRGRCSSARGLGARSSVLPRAHLARRALTPTTSGTAFRRMVNALVRTHVPSSSV
jgi:hypothetical protein